MCQQFGTEAGLKLYAEIGQRLLELLATVDARNNVAVKKHLAQNILPAISCYQVLRGAGLEGTKAEAFTVSQMHERAQKAGKLFHRLSKIPGFYRIFQKSCTKAMQNNYPEAGWDMRWQKNDQTEIAFNCHRCVYWDVTTDLGCPELCPAFCANDDIVYGALYPKVWFLRTKTLANGGDYCDFRLVNGKWAKQHLNK